MTTIPKDIEKKLKAVVRRIEEAAAFDGVGNEDFNRATSVKNLVNIAGMSERSLRDWFKKYMGVSLSTYARNRRVNYAARIFRLFPDTSKSKVSQFIGLNSSNALYPYMKKAGVEDLDALRSSDNLTDFTLLNFTIECLPDSILFYTMNEVLYDECSDVEFEEYNWNKINSFITSKIPEASIIGDVGFAIDRYVENKIDEGIFVAGILCKKISKSSLSKDLIGDIGWRFIQGQKYAVFTHIGNYGGLTDFYNLALQTLRHNGDILVDKSLLIMEKYINSPIDTPNEELITEIWIPIG